jgi:hypothetical protein
MFASGPSSLHDHDPDPAGQNGFDPLDNCCCICYHAYGFATMDPHAEDPVQLACGHVFGTICIEKWREMNSTCPMCRAELNESFNYIGSFSWQNDVGYYTDGESEADSGEEFFDAQEEFVICLLDVEDTSATRQQVYSQPGQDVWLTAVYEQQHISMKSDFSSVDIESVVLNLEGRFDKQYTAIKPNFSSFEIEPPEDHCFDELVNYHGQWVADSVAGEESKDEYAIGYFDVFP